MSDDETCIFRIKNCIDTLMSQIPYQINICICKIESVWVNSELSVPADSLFIGLKYL